MKVCQNLMLLSTFQLAMMSQMTTAELVKKLISQSVFLVIQDKKS